MQNHQLNNYDPSLGIVSLAPYLKASRDPVSAPIYGPSMSYSTRLICLSCCAENADLRGVFRHAIFFRDMDMADLCRMFDFSVEILKPYRTKLLRAAAQLGDFALRVRAVSPPLWVSDMVVATMAMHRAVCVIDAYQDGLL